MKKIFLFTYGIFLAAAVSAQITLQPNIPAVGMVQKDGLWNILAVNNSNTNYECRLELVLRDRLTGQELITAATGQFALKPGAGQLNVNMLNPIRYNYFATGMDGKLQGLIPAGTYTACYVLTATGTKEINLAEECVPFDVEPLSPPMLIFPADSAQEEISPAQFSWTPPAPEGMFDRLHYEVLITPVNEGQKGNEAIQENMPLFSDNNVLANTMNYSVGLPAFEKDKWYAWQVIAKDERNYAGKSETWVFKVKSPVQPKVDPAAKSYVVLKRDRREAGISSISGDHLYIKYYSFDKENKNSIRIADATGKTVQEIQQVIIYGDNFFNIKLSRAINSGQVYTITITDGKNNEHAALFTIN
jgi:hypothetical protein